MRWVHIVTSSKLIAAVYAYSTVLTYRGLSAGR